PWPKSFPASSHFGVINKRAYALRDDPSHDLCMYSLKPSARYFRIGSKPFDERRQVKVHLLCRPSPSGGLLRFAQVTDHVKMTDIFCFGAPLVSLVALLLPVERRCFVE